MTPTPLPTLWQRFKGDGCQQSRQELIERHAYLVKITSQKQFKLPAHIEFDDLKGAGFLGLIKAVDLFDPTRGVKFETYAITLIRGAMLEMRREDDWVPRAERQKQKRGLVEPISQVSLENIICVSMGPMPLLLCDILRDERPSALDQILEAEKDQELLRAIERLPERERTVIALYYHESLTFKEIGSILKISESRTYQLHTQAITRLRGYLERTFVEGGF